MFIGERYSEFRDMVAQLKDQITGVTTREANVLLAFAISARFVRDCMQVNFTDIVNINMSCVSYYSDEIARSFVVKAAWDPDHGAVRNYYLSESASLTFKGYTYSHRKTQTS